AQGHRAPDAAAARDHRAALSRRPSHKGRRHADRQTREHGPWHPDESPRVAARSYGARAMSEQAERELMRFAARIAAYERPQAPATMRAAVRASLLAAPIALPRRGPWWSRVASLRPLFAAATIAIVLISAGIPAAGASLSGDPLFGLKRAAEETAVALAFDDGARLEQLVTLSDHRLSELVIASSSRPNALAAATREYLAALDRVAQQLGA